MIAIREAVVFLCDNANLRHQFRGVDRQKANSQPRGRAPFDHPRPFGPSSWPNLRWYFPRITNSSVFCAKMRTSAGNAMSWLTTHSTAVCAETSMSPGTKPSPPSDTSANSGSGALRRSSMGRSALFFSTCYISLAISAGSRALGGLATICVIGTSDASSSDCFCSA